MSTVYVVQDQRKRDKKTKELVSKFNLKDAERYGNLKFLLGPAARPFASTIVIDKLCAQLRYFTDNDYLLLIGNPSLIGFAVAIASWANNGIVNILQWDGMAYEYQVINAKLPADFDENKTNADSR